MTTASVKLKKGEGRSLKAGGAWIYDNEIAEIQDTMVLAFPLSVISVRE